MVRIPSPSSSRFPTSALNLYADWTETNGPGTQFTIPASTVVSGPSAGVGVTINT